jgi:hypothetical protein
MAEPITPAAPSIGRIVHYVLPTHYAPVHCPALVTEVLAEQIVHLTVFAPPPYPTIEQRMAITYDDSGYPNTWHWPERT